MKQQNFFKDENSKLIPETKTKKGLLVLDFDSTTVDSNYEVFPELKEVLPRLAKKGIEIVILTSKPWNETKMGALDTAFGKERTFLTKDDIYDSNWQGQNDVTSNVKGVAVKKIMELKGYTIENTHFVDDDEAHVKDALVNYKIPSTVVKSKLGNADVVEQGFYTGLEQELMQQFNLQPQASKLCCNII